MSTGEINFFSFKIDEWTPDDLISIILCRISLSEYGVIYTLKIVDKVYIVNEGAIFYEGDPISAVKDERIKKFYLGSNFQL